VAGEITVIPCAGSPVRFVMQLESRPTCPFPAGRGTTEQSSRAPWTGVQSSGLDARPGHGLGPGERQQRNPWVVPRGLTSV
jgi:hypothetical protein